MHLYDRRRGRVGGERPKRSDSSPLALRPAHPESGSFARSQDYVRWNHRQADAEMTHNDAKRPLFLNP